MNEQLQNAVASLINESLSLFEKGKTFLSTEIPDVVQQLLLWHATVSFLYTLMGIGILLGLTYFDYKQWVFWTTEVKDRYDNLKKRIEGEHGPFALLNVFQLLPIIYAISLFNLTWLQILIAPKIFLIEYAAKLIK